MRVLPDSLFWRLILVLFTGLLTSQLVSFVINYEERDQLLSQTETRQSAQRIADSVVFIEAMSDQNNLDGRSDIQLLGMHQNVVIRPVPVAVSSNQDDNLSTGVFSRQLKEQLGEGRDFRVTQINGSMILNSASHGMGMGRGHGRRGGMHRRIIETPPPQASAENPGAYFLVQVQLADGNWAVFNIFISKSKSYFSKKMLFTLLVSVLIVMVVSFICVRWVTRPLLQLTGAAEKFGNSIHQEVLPENGPLEIRTAAHAFNVMQKRLQSLIEDRSHIFAAMSHDLKTPITRLRLRTEMLGDEALMAHFEKDLQEMETMVTQALDFMKGLNTKEALQSVDIMALLDSIQDDYVVMGKTVVVEGFVQKPFPCFPQLLRRSIVNLIDNAIFYGHEARIFVSDDDKQIRIAIRDKGRGMTEDELTQAFEPFFRVEGSRSRKTGGAGLGLTIALDIVQKHGGKIILDNCPGGGLEAMLVLPRMAVLR